MTFLKKGKNATSVCAPWKKNYCIKFFLFQLKWQ